MSNLTKWLAACAGLLIGLEVAGPTVWGLLFHRLENERQAFVKVSRQLRSKELALRKAEATARSYEAREKLNFEPDVAKARLAYQEYLLRLCDACSLSSVVITSSQPERLDELGHVLNFSIQATGTTDQFGKLFDGFYRTEALHRLAHVNIFQSLGPDSPTHSLALDVALLVLDSKKGAIDELTPPASSTLTDVFASRDIFRKPAQTTGAPSDSSLASSMNMLGSFFNSLPTPPPEPPVAAQMLEPTLPSAPPPDVAPAVDIDPKASLRLVGIITNGQNKYALFFDAAKDVQHSLLETADLRPLGIDARITRIAESEIQLIEKEQPLQLALGQLYQEAAP